MMPGSFTAMRNWRFVICNAGLALMIAMLPMGSALADGGGDGSNTIKAMLKAKKNARKNPRKPNKRRRAKRKPRTATTVVKRKSAPTSPTRARATAPRSAPNTQTGIQFRRGEILVTFAAGVTESEILRVARQFQLRRLSEQQFDLIAARIYRFALRANASAGQVLQLANDPRTSAVQPNYVYRLAADGSVQYALTKLNVVKAHALATGTGVAVGLIDSGIYTQHPALAGIETEQFKAVDHNQASERSHGTAVASLIAGRKRVAGIAPRVKILSARAFTVSPKGGAARGNTFDLLKALDWTVERGARILNLSVAVVAAAGNGGPDAPPAYPAAYEGVIAATAIDGNDRPYRAANRGAYISVAAPGVDVFAASGKSGFGFKSGTSMAAAYVSGSVALILQRRPQFTPVASKRLLEKTSRDLGQEGKDREFGAGLIDTLRALHTFSN